MPVHYLYGGSTASYAVYGQSDFVTVDPSEAWAEGTKVRTLFLRTFMPIKLNGGESLEFTITLERIFLIIIIITSILLIVVITRL